MSVNDKKVCEIIKDKINWASGTTRPNHIGNAFDLISEDREKNFPGDPNYAAAEHYLFARWLVGYTSVFGYILIQPSNLIYSAVKGLIGAEHIPRFGNGPVTPASYEDFLWGGRGANDGLDDTFTRIDFSPRSSKPEFPSACK